MKKEQLQTILDILGLPASVRNDENAEKILTFLMTPIDEGKQIPERKMSMRATTKSNTNSKESIPTDEEEKTEVNQRIDLKKDFISNFRMVMMMMNYFMLMMKKKKKKMQLMMIILVVMMKVV